MCSKSHFVTIDPGARKNGGTGVAQFKRDNDPVASKFYLKNSRTIFATDGNNYEERVDFICKKLQLEMYPEPFSQSTTVFIERPKFFDDKRGLTAAKSDSLFKLIFLYGRLYQLFHQLGYTVVPLEINHWKGHLTKAQTKQRLRKMHTFSSNESSDEIDAIAMGYYILGKFK